MEKSVELQYARAQNVLPFPCTTPATYVRAALDSEMQTSMLTDQKEDSDLGIFNTSSKRKRSTKREEYLLTLPPKSISWGEKKSPWVFWIIPSRLRKSRAAREGTRHKGMHTYTNKKVCKDEYVFGEEFKIEVVYFPTKKIIFLPFLSRCPDCGVGVRWGGQRHIARKGRESIGP